MLKPFDREFPAIILGGGLTGLSAGYALTKAGVDVRIFEQSFDIGGLSRTICRDGFRFDLGGHRFFTTKPEIDSFVRNLMGGEMIAVPRKSTIFLRNNYFDYPLKPLNALCDMGIPTAARIIEDYVAEKIKALRKTPQQVSLEDWVIFNFGRTMFNIYFKEYSEKVWGIDCKRISVDWVAQRIRGLSLGAALRNAFFKLGGTNVPSLVDRFDYPRLGIGRIAERLREEIEKENVVNTGISIKKIGHSRSVIEGIEIESGSGSGVVSGQVFISSIPVTKLVGLLDPPVPNYVLDAASKLMFRGLVVVAVMIDRKRATDQTWIYVPEKKIPFGRIHEPTNWSEKMAPDGKTILVAEYFSFEGDGIWNTSDEQLADMTFHGLERLGFVKKSEVIGSYVVRVRQAYPLFEVGYAEKCAVLYNYLGAFRNLRLAGRTGMFRYYNMDHAIESGLRAADSVIQQAKGDSKLSVDAVAKVA